MPEKDRRVSRREFIIKSVAGAGLMAAFMSPLKILSNQAKASDGHTDAPQVAGDPNAKSWCMVIDLKKCDGCVTIDSPPQCTQACIQGHFVPKGQQWIQVFDVELPGEGHYFLPLPCNQCENAPCVNVCPVAATYHNEDGIVLIDHFRCIGCRMCMAACPYQRRFFNWGDAEVPPEALKQEYSPLYPVPAVRGTVIKCMFCAHMLREDKLPLCVQGCPMKAIYMGELKSDMATNGTEIVELSRFLAENNAFRWKEELGTQPRVWFLPGHGEKFNRHAQDKRPLLKPVWSWGGEGFDKKVGVWPWGKE